MTKLYKTIAKLLCSPAIARPYRYKDFFTEGQGKLRMKYMPTNNLHN